MKWKFHIIRSIKILRNFFANLKLLMGLYPRLKTVDRTILEQKIFTFLTSSNFYKRILFVGCEWYTKYYEKIFIYKDYWTLDIDPLKTKYGAKQHICDAFQNIPHYFTLEKLDVIVCNGVFGWGLNEKKEIEQAYKNAYACLKENGLLVVGWNDVPQRKPVDFDQFAILSGFKRYIFPCFNQSRYYTQSKNAHVFDFYIKKENK